MSKVYSIARATVGGVALATTAAGMAQSQDVAGLYAGVSVGAHGGTFEAFGSDYTFNSGAAAGAFVGYNVVSGNLVYGGELAWSTGVSTDAYGVDSINNLIDVKGRLGTMMGSTLVYGAIGYSYGKISQFSADASISGPSIGVGFEMPFGSNGFVGGDLTTRFVDASGTIFGGPAEPYVQNGNLTTASVRLGFRF